MTITEHNSKQVLLPEHAADILRAILSAEDDIGQDQEHFWVIGLNGGKRVKYVDLVHLGSLNECHVHPREIFRRAVSDGCDSIVIGHNHPSGSSDPSAEDLDITKRLKTSGEILGIDLLDHVILGQLDYTSLSERDLL